MVQCACVNCDYFDAQDYIISSYVIIHTAVVYD
jgi:hypothetical protein